MATEALVMEMYSVSRRLKPLSSSTIPIKIPSWPLFFQDETSRNKAFHSEVIMMLIVIMISHAFKLAHLSSAHKVRPSITLTPARTTT